MKVTELHARTATGTQVRVVRRGGWPMLDDVYIDGVQVQVQTAARLTHGAATVYMTDAGRLTLGHDPACTPQWEPA